MGGARPKGALRPLSAEGRLFPPRVSPRALNLDDLGSLVGQQHPQQRPVDVAAGQRRFVDDLPGGGRRLVQDTIGIEYTIVTGVVT